MAAVIICESKQEGTWGTATKQMWGQSLGVHLQPCWNLGSAGPCENRRHSCAFQDKPPSSQHFKDLIPNHVTQI